MYMSNVYNRLLRWLTFKNKGKMWLARIQNVFQNPIAKMTELDYFGRLTFGYERIGTKFYLFSFSGIYCRTSCLLY